MQKKTSMIPKIAMLSIMTVLMMTFLYPESSSSVNENTLHKDSLLLVDQTLEHQDMHNGIVTRELKCYDTSSGTLKEITCNVIDIPIVPSMN